MIKILLFLLLTNAIGIVTIVFNIPKDAEEGSSWDMVNENDLWEGGNVELDPEDYVLVGQEDIMDGIASFMAAYLLSLKQTKVRIIFLVACPLVRIFTMIIIILTW